MAAYIMPLELIIGFIAGVLGSLLGIGGGVFLIPAAVLLLGLSQPVAQGIALAVIVPTAALGSAIHYRQKNVQLNTVVWIVPPVIVTAIISASVANSIDMELLRRIFAVFLLFMSGWMIFMK